MGIKLKYVVLLVVCAVLWKKFINEGCVFESDKSLEGKTVIITGGNAGIGKATAIECAKRKAHLIIASRNVEKSMAARDDIIEETGHDDIHVMKLDLGDLDSVTEFANEILTKEKHVDYLVNNAGVLFMEGVTKQGFGKVFGINHLGHFLLTNLLLDRMKEQSASRPVRIINVSSEGYKFGTLNFTDLHLEHADKGWFKNFGVYFSSKVSNIYFTSALAKRLETFNIDVFSLHPGAISSDIGLTVSNFYEETLYNKIWFISLNLAVAPFLRSNYYGCQTTMVCLLDDSISQYSGDYFSSCAREELYDHAKDITVEEKLWDLSVNLVQPWLPK